MAAKSTSVATKKEAGLPAETADLFNAAGAKHTETLGKDDMSIPFLSILQSLSPQCTKGEAEFIKGCEPSDLFHSVSQKFFKTHDDDDNQITGVQVIPLVYKRSFIEWVTRANGGGYVNEYSVEEGMSIITARNDLKQDIIQEGSPIGTPGNQLNDTHSHFVLVMDGSGSASPAVITMASTQIKPSRDWNSLISEQMNTTGWRRFTWAWNVTTVRRSNDHGSWYVWKFEDPTRLDETNLDDWQGVFKRADEFADGIISGEHKADHAKAAAEENPSASGSGGATKGTGDGDDEIPF